MIPNRSSYIDAIAGTLFGMGCIWFVVLSRWEAQDAAARYGHNVDSGVLELAFALLYLGPGAMLFSVAAVAVRRRWRFAQALHWLSFVFASVPVVAAAVLYIIQPSHSAKCRTTCAAKNTWPVEVARFARPGPNPSVKGTPTSGLRPLAAAPYVERYAS